MFFSETSFVRYFEKNTFKKEELRDLLTCTQAEIDYLWAFVDSKAFVSRQEKRQQLRGKKYSNAKIWALELVFFDTLRTFDSKNYSNAIKQEAWQKQAKIQKEITESFFTQVDTQSDDRSIMRILQGPRSERNLLHELSNALPLQPHERELFTHYMPFLVVPLRNSTKVGDANTAYWNTLEAYRIEFEERMGTTMQGYHSEHDVHDKLHALIQALSASIYIYLHLPDKDQGKVRTAIAKNFNDLWTREYELRLFDRKNRGQIPKK